MCVDCNKTPQVGVMDLYAPCKNKDMKGKILEKEGQNYVPLAYVNVYNETSKKGTITDSNGSYFLEAKAGDSIQISHISYKTIKNIAKNIPNPLILEENINELKEVVVTPSMQKERDQDLNHSTRNVVIKPSNNEKLSKAKTWIWLAILGGAAVFAFYNINKKATKVKI